MFAYEQGAIPANVGPNYGRRNTDEMGRPSPISSLSTGLSSRGSKRQVEFSSDTNASEFQGDGPPSGDQYPDSRIDFIPLTKLSQAAIESSHRLRNLIGSVDFFRQLANRQTNASDDLLQDLNRKLKPQIIDLDEDASLIVDDIKVDIDQCRITDRRVTVLLMYCAFFQDIHKILDEIMINVLDVLEKHLRLLERGAIGFSFSQSDIQRDLRRIAEDANQLELRVRKEAQQGHKSPSATRIRFA